MSAVLHPLHWIPLSFISRILNLQQPTFMDFISLCLFDHDYSSRCPSILYYLSGYCGFSIRVCMLKRFKYISHFADGHMSDTLQFAHIYFIANLAEGVFILCFQLAVI